MPISDDIQWLMTQDICGIISEKDRLQLEQYLQVPEYQSYYQHLKSRLDNINLADPELGGFSAQQIAAMVQTNDRMRRKKKTMLIRLSAACVTVIAMIAGFWLYLSPSQHSTVAGISVKIDGHQQLDLSHTKGTFEGGTYSISDSILTVKGNGENKIVLIDVPAGKKYKVRLPDSSVVQLNSGSSLSYSLDFNTERNATIKGEGFFDVRKSLAPFTVTAGNLSVQVLGTTFNVNSYKPGMVVIGLVTGGLKVTAGSKFMLLKPGNLLIHRDNQMQIASLEPDRDLGWLNGYYSFNSYPLDSLALDIERIYAVKVIVSGQTSSRVTGTLLISDLKGSLLRLQSAGLMDYKFDGTGHLIIWPAGEHR